MTHDEEMRSLARGALIALLAVIGALVFHLRAGDGPAERRGAVAMKRARTPAPPVAQTPEP
jgi:hypothetical protein